MLSLNLLNAKAQQNDTLEIQRNDRGIVNFIRFRLNPERKIQNDTIILRSILHARKEDGFKSISESKDELDMIHKKFQQYYRGIKIENAEYLIHGKNGIIETLNGNFEPVKISSIKPSIDESQALRKALIFVNSKKYKWEDEPFENFIKQRTNNPDATYYPKGELVIAKDYIKGSRKFRLAWKFTISSLIPNNEQWIYIDAVSGEVIGNTPLILNANTIGTAQTRYNSQVLGIICDSYSQGYRLNEIRNTTLGNSVNIHTKNCLSTPNYLNALEFSNTNTDWVIGSWPAIETDQVALDAHWGQEKVLDYWSTVHSRNSLNNQGISIAGYVHYYDPNRTDIWPNNAAWDRINHVMFYGDGDGLFFNPLVALDVAGHEMGHGITQFTANFSSTSYREECDALNEGFSDIWGACVEHHAAPNKQTWLIGEDIIAFPGYNCLRDIQNPNSSAAAEGQHPNTYNGQFWRADGEPHNNSTVLSHWFYLLSQGGSGTNDLGNAYNVSGIGIEIAEKVAYKAESSYLFSSANYNDARNATISAVRNLYPLDPCKEAAVINAWYAVGVGAEYSGTGGLFINGASLLCTSGTYTIDNLPAGASVTWSGPSNIVSLTPDGNAVTASRVGDGQITLTATVTNVCGANTVVINRTIDVGAPVLEIISDIHCQQGQIIQSFLFTALPDPVSPTRYNWGYMQNGVPTRILDTQQTIQKKFGLGPHTIYVFGDNSCDSGERALFNFEVVPCSGFQLETLVLTVSPNPASSELNLNIKENNDTESLEPDIKLAQNINRSTKISLYNINSSVLVKQWSFSEADNYNYLLNIAGFKGGIFVLKVERGNKIGTAKVIIQ